MLGAATRVMVITETTGQGPTHGNAIKRNKNSDDNLRDTTLFSQKRLGQRRAFECG